MSVPEPYWSDEDATLYLGDCLDALPSLPACSVDAIVTDPPYGLAELSAAVVLKAVAAWMAGDRVHVPDGRGFMGREWDRFVPPPGAWDECMRVLKPGGHLLSFAGSRTVDLMTLSIRIAGFEIRDSIPWLYGQGYPKSHNVAKAIDQRRFGSADAAAFKVALAEAVAASGKTRQQINVECGFTMRFDIAYEKDPIGWGCSLPTVDQYADNSRVLAIDGDLQEVAALREWPRTRLECLYQVVGYEDRLNSPSGIVSVGGKASPVRREITAPGTENAARWEGWGTALKPAHEPIVVARKPLSGTVAANVLEFGTGALNIDGCRVATADDMHRTRNTALGVMNDDGWLPQRQESDGHDAGRWPPNVLLDPVAAKELDRQSGALTSDANPTRRGSDKFRDAYGEFAGQEECTPQRGADSGGASRFFPVFRYEAKAAASERPRLPDGTAWPTVKPLDLMRWLVRLVTPPGGTVLDPFAGSGTTAEACIVEGFPCVLIDKDPVAAELIKVRLSKPIQPTLFGDVA